jgi:Uma2 family endonuclease
VILVNDGILGSVTKMTTEILNPTEIIPMLVQLHPVVEMTDDQFFEFCQLNRDWRIERTAQGDLVIMPPTGAETDSLKMLREKMQEYIDNGASLGWLIDRTQRKVYIYRPSTSIEELDNPSMVLADPLLSGFVLDLSQIW